MDTGRQAIAVLRSIVIEISMCSTNEEWQWLCEFVVGRADAWERKRPDPCHIGLGGPS